MADKCLLVLSRHDPFYHTILSILGGPDLDCYPKSISMNALATIGGLIEVTPCDEIQYWRDAESNWILIDDPSPFCFRVSGELIDDGVFFGLFGPVESGPNRYQNLICNVFLRIDDSDWRNTTKCGAGFKVAPSIAKRDPNYNPAENSEMPFFFHPEGTSVDGYPQISRYAGIRAIEDT